MQSRALSINYQTATVLPEIVLTAHSSKMLWASVLQEVDSEETQVQIPLPSIQACLCELVYIQWFSRHVQKQLIIPLVSVSEGLDLKG